MKKRIVVLFNVVIYIISAVFYASKGLVLMLAEETTTAYTVSNKYGKSYSYLNFNL